ncbi:DUF2207 domain-containing protein [Thermopetrobacter sp. TC1]|uniref:DUF2207 family protein n=1 Tax=Thermopetrobacter sp. TC1 TaxID=1495045 RepID=UPI000570F4ED|nr:DUF2207 domain-containing protein [Thermopetrobacter sp. TC1]
MKKSRSNRPVIFEIIMMGSMLIVFLILEIHSFVTDNFDLPTPSPKILFVWVVSGTAAVIAIYATAWWLAGRNPSPAAIALRWEPPENLSPAQAVFLKDVVWRKVPDTHRAFTTALVSLATKRYIGIKRKTDETRLIQLKQADTTLPPEEQQLMKILFSDENQLILDKRKSKLAKDIRKRFGRELNTYIEKHFIDKNSNIIKAGIIIAVIISLVFIFFDISYILKIHSGLFILRLGLFFASIGISPFIYRIIKFIMQSFGHKANNFHAILVLLVTLFIMFFILLPNIPMDPLIIKESNKNFLLEYLSLFLVLLVLPSVIMAAWYLLPRPTPEARRLLDELEGLRMFLKSTAGHHPHQAMHLSARPMSASKYQALLPWAVALGVEQEWTSAFRKWLPPMEANYGVERSQANFPEINPQQAGKGAFPLQPNSPVIGGHQQTEMIPRTTVNPAGTYGSLNQ